MYPDNGKGTFFALTFESRIFLTHKCEKEKSFLKLDEH